MQILIIVLAYAKKVIFWQTNKELFYKILSFESQAEMSKYTYEYVLKITRRLNKECK